MTYQKKAIIVDLDNTVYPVSSIGNDVLGPVFDLIDDRDNYQGNLGDIKQMLMRKPFQYVAAHFHFSEELMDEGTRLLQATTYNKPMHPYPDYPFLKELSVPKYLVTAGFTNLQNSKIDSLGVRHDFNKIYIVDSSISIETKQSTFQTILDENSYHAKDILVVGDDPESELRAARNLHLDCVLVDKMDLYPHVTDFAKIKSFSELVEYL